MGIRVLVASHIRLYREALGRVLEQPTEHATALAQDVVLVGLAASAPDAVEQVRRLTPDITLLDMAMADAFSVARHLTRLAGAHRIVALGMAEDEAEVLNCAQLGIAGYVTREASIAEMLAAIEATARGEVHCSPKIAGSLFRRIATLSTERSNGGAPNALTARESQILRLLQQGLSNKMISRSLGIELPTVKNHVHSILAKLGIHRRTEAISLLYLQTRAEDSRAAAELAETP
ncbi:MAG: LuxR C-terminal-related transcriptional regulator [Steroidobacteraceae bacterium]